MPKQKLLIVDDDQAFTAKLAGALEGLFQVEACHSELEFHEHNPIGRFDLIIMDMRLREGKEGLDLLKWIHARDALQPVIVMTAYADPGSYLDAIEAGALNYLDKQEFSPGLIARTVESLARQGALQRRVAELERQLAPLEPTEIIGVSDAIRQVRSALHRAADDDKAPVLIVGEPGTGRVLAARYLHYFSRARKNGPFIPASCSNYRPTEVGERLFGVSHHPESDRSDSKGWLDSAKGGILLVNNAHTLTGKVLENLSGYLETGGFQRVGGESYVESNAQLILSNVPNESDGTAPDGLWTMVERHGGMTIDIPPLRERREDINPLTHHILNTLHRRGETRVRSFRASTLAILEESHWPGNVRELKSAVEYAAIRADAMGEAEIAPGHLPQTIVESAARSEFTAGLTAFGPDYQRHLARAELALVSSSMEILSTTKQADLAARLHYNDRYTFARRLRRCFEKYPELEREFPKVRGLLIKKDKPRP